jgi:hypothetical protein
LCELDFCYNAKEIADLECAEAAFASVIPRTSPTDAKLVDI